MTTRYRRVEGWTQPDGTVTGWVIDVFSDRPYEEQPPLWHPTAEAFHMTEGASHHDDTTTVDVRLDGHVVVRTKPPLEVAR